MPRSQVNHNHLNVDQPKLAKASCTGLYGYLEELLVNVHQGGTPSSHFMYKVAKKHIPEGFYRTSRPNFPTEAASLADERAVFRISNPIGPIALKHFQTVSSA